MPFWDKIATYINDTLKEGSLNNAVLQPQQYFGLATIIVRSKDLSKPNVTEQLPAIIPAIGNNVPITPDDSYAIQVYHKLDRSTYEQDPKKSFGNNYLYRETSEMYMVVLTNSKLSGITKEVLEPVVRFGIPQNLSAALMTELKLKTCIIKPISSNMKHVEVCRQEYPQADYFLNEQMSIMLIRYNVVMTFTSAGCIDLASILN